MHDNNGKMHIQTVELLLIVDLKLLKIKRKKKMHTNTTRANLLYVQYNAHTV